MKQNKISELQQIDCIEEVGDGTFTMQDYNQIIAELRSHWYNMPKHEENKETNN